jgi:hypothetical protein
MVSVQVCPVLHKHPERVKREKSEFGRAGNKITHILYLSEILQYNYLMMNNYPEIQLNKNRIFYQRF